MRKHWIFLLGIAIIGYIGCQPNVQTADSPVVEKTSLNGVPVELLADKQYMHLTGTIKGLPITMDLNFKKIEDDSVGYYYGCYSYDKYQEPIEVMQKTDTAGVIFLKERYAYDEANAFVGQFEGDTYQGKWHDGYRNFSFPFKLKLYDGSDIVYFQSMTMSDTVRASDKSDVYADYSVQSLWPTDKNPTNKLPFLEKVIMKVLSGDMMEAKDATPEAYFVRSKKDYFDNYRSLVKETLKESDTIPYHFNHAQHSHMDVIWNSNGILSIGGSSYDYSGGAHGMYGTHYYAVDVSQEKFLDEKDIFLPNYKPVVTAALKRAVNRKFDSDMNDYTPLDAIQFEYLLPNDNFYVTGGGVGYNFVPYEIGPYAIGEIQVFVPKSELFEVIRPEFKARMGW